MCLVVVAVMRLQSYAEWKFPAILIYDEIYCDVPACCRLWLEFVEHCYLAVEACNDVFELRMTALDYECHIVITVVIAFHLYSPNEVVLPLLIAIKPTEEQSCSLGLLVVGSTAHIEHNVGVLTEELLYDADDRLGNLLVTGRLLLFGIGEVEPVGGIIRVRIQFKVHMILNAHVGNEHIVVANAMYIIRRATIDGFKVESVHVLISIRCHSSPFQRQPSCFAVESPILHSL